MSKVALEGNASGTGTFTIASPNSNNSRTMGLPDSAGDLVVTQATQTLSNKTFSGAQVFGTASLAEPSGGAPLYMARAWVNFNGTGTVAIRAAGNVTSITDNGTGNYIINFTTALPDVNYAVVISAGLGSGGGSSTTSLTSTKSTTAAGVFTFTSAGGAFEDNPNVQVAIFR
jgi:hypothetical protein